MLKLVLVFVATMISLTTARAAASLVGPVSIPCKQAMSSQDNTSLYVMWISGFASAANRLSKSDFLEGKTIFDVLELMNKECKGQPERSMEDVAIAVIAQFRMEAVAKLQYQKQKK